MKKLLSIIMSITLVLMNVSAMAADAGEMETALVSVKGKISVDPALTEFHSRTETDDETFYTFYWADKENTRELAVASDSKGNIKEYEYYFSNMYSSRPKLSPKSKAEYQAFAEEFLKKAAPEPFSDVDDCLVPYDSELSVIRRGECTLNWVRERSGITVPSNTASVTVIYADGKLIVSRAYINWDYDAEFKELDGESIADSTAAYFAKYPVELVYMPTWEYNKEIHKSEQKQKLVYRFTDNEMGYIDAYSGEKVVEDCETEIFRNMSAAGNLKGDMMEEVAADSALTPEEKQELETVAGLKTADEIIETVTDMGCFGEIPGADKFSSHLYKTDNEYEINLYSYGEDGSMSITADAKTGKLLNLYSYEYTRGDRKEYTDADYTKAEECVDSLLNNYYGSELGECAEPAVNKDNGYSVSCLRLINGIKSTSNKISVEYDMQRGVISSFSLKFTKDLSVFPSPENIISLDAAKAEILENAPIVQQYIKSNGTYVCCYCPDTDYAFNVDAFTGEAELYAESRRVYTYTDISGHWAENKIKALAEMGIGINSESFNPDKPVTQKDLLVMMYSTVNYPIAYTADFYDYVADIVSEAEIAPDSLVKREDAFKYLTGFMGLSKIASMNTIFKTDFADNSNISADRVGAAAILTGYGIISGDGAGLKPQNNITSAEAASMLYNYLIAE